MKSKFPQMKQGEVALIFADINTGIVVDANFDIIQDGQPMYTVFDNIDKATAYAKGILHKNPKLEFVIYDVNEAPLMHYNIDTIQ